ncbi:MAG: glycosyl hydrolase, partial [Actinomycetota bacterium]|nr:glycosyl hydrolase [Actinomycetota bacterium]
MTRAQNPRGRFTLMLLALLAVAAAAVWVSNGRELLWTTAGANGGSSSQGGLAPTTTAAGTGTESTGTEPPTPSPADTQPSGTAPTETAPVDPHAWMQDVGEQGRTFLGVSTETDTDAEIEAFAAAAERLPDVVMVSRDWASGGFDETTADRLSDAGHLPMIAWEPWNHSLALSGDRLRAVQPAYALSTIAEGHHDDTIRAWASDAADWGRPIALRFAHEMNGYWYPWAESANGNDEGDYVAAWQHTYDLFIEEGATNVIWVWSPNLSQPSLTPLAQLWPGEAYVDWVGLVGYLGNGIDPAQWTPTFDELFGPTLIELREFTDRPVVITEIGATEQGGKKAEWTAHVLETVAERDDIDGLMWFEIDKEADWRIVSSPEARAAFAAGVADDEVWGIPRAGRPTSALV